MVSPISPSLTSNCPCEPRNNLTLTTLLACLRKNTLPSKSGIILNWLSGLTPNTAPISLLLPPPSDDPD